MEHIYVLPNEVWCEIFKLISDVADLIRIQAVSRVWRDQIWNTITALNLSPIQRKLDEKILRSIFTPTRSLRKLDLTGCTRLSDDGLAALQLVPKLTSLTLAFCSNFTAEGLEHISSLSQLEELDCNGLFQVWKHFAAEQDLLPHLKLQRSTLKRLNLSGALIHEMERIVQFSNLTSLNLRGCPFLNEGVSPYLPLKKLTNLRALDLSHMSARTLSNKALLELSIALTNLQQLVLEKQSKLESDGFANISCLQHLELINIMGIRGLNTSEVVAHLRHCTKLKTLMITPKTKLHTLRSNTPPSSDGDNLLTVSRIEDESSTKAFDDFKEIKAAFVQDICIITKK